MLASLRRERLSLVNRIRRREVDYGTGARLVSRIRDFDRAINAFESLEEPSFEEQVRRERIESARELIDLVREFDRI